MLNALKISLQSRAFIISALILVSSAYGLRRTADWMDIQFRKQAAPIAKPLKYLEREALLPYVFRHNQVLQPEEEESLGTREYISWLLEDTLVEDKRDPLRYVRLFITYYTGSPDPVPHVPDVCYLGAGYRPAGDGNGSFEMPELAAHGYATRVPFRALTFIKPGDLGDLKPTVVYTFGVNNVLEAERNKVRRIMAGITTKRAYFSKLEVSFGLGRAYPEPEEAVEAAKKVFRKVLPLLVKDHWPDLKTLDASQDASAAKQFAADG